jgi:hypothetical protein
MISNFGLWIKKWALLATSFHAGFLLALFFSPEDGGDVQWTTWCYVPEDRISHGNRSLKHIRLLR